MKFFPIFFQLEGRRCLVVGGGNVGTRRARALVAAGAIVDVVSPVCRDGLRELFESGDGELIEREYDERLMRDDYFCVVAATDNRKVNREIAEQARARGIPVNNASARNDCDFIFPALIDRDPIMIAITNLGGSPVLSKILRQQLNRFLPDAYGDLSRFVGEHRDEINAAIADERTRVEFWQHLLQGAIAEAVLSGNHDLARCLLRQALAEPERFNRQGEVYLIGAGPGAPDLLTLRAFRLLQRSDVVLYDRLVSPEVMALVPPGAERIYVGKQRADHSLPQTDINQLLVEHASQGRRVTRLKGGDPFIFGRGGEEIERLVDAGVAFQVVPGITAASGCSAYAGIPLTHRDYAQSVQFVAGYLKDGSIDLDWKELVADDKTLVFYMGLNTMPTICASLIEHGMPAEMPIALVEKGTTREQRVLISTLAQLPARLETIEVASPSLCIVGRVVQLADRLQWYRSDAEVMP